MRCRPVISVEFGYAGYSAYGHKPADLTRLASDLDYRIFDIPFTEYRTDADFLENVDGYFWDFFLVPQERMRFASCTSVAAITAWPAGSTAT